MKHILAIGLLALAIPASAQDTGDALLAQLNATRVAVISDGDFLASTYADAELAPHGRYGDVLTLFTRVDGRIIRSSVEVSNSVTAAPEILVASPDGRMLYAVDRLARATPEARRTPDLAPGRTLTVARADEAGTLSIAATREIPPSSEGLALSPDGRWLAVVGNDAQRATLAIVPLRDGLPGEPVVFDVANLGLTGTGEGPRSGLTLTNVQWRPDGRALAVNDNTGGRVAFFRFEAGEQPNLSAWGAPVATGPDPFVGRFTPNGRFYLTSEWGRDFAAADLDGRLPTTPGTLGVTRLDEDGQHERVREIATDSNPEGIAISPDGRLIATVNMRSTLFPGQPRFTREATVTLLAFDPGTGDAQKLSDTPFEGVLPEGATFDVDGGHLLVTVFQGHEGQADQAGLVVFRVDRSGETPRLVQAGRIAAPHGVHHVVVTP